MIKSLQGKYAGQTAWIVGRGASLLHISREDIGAGPVIVLNEAIINVAPLGLPNVIFNIWRNGDVLPDLPKYGVNLILCDNPVGTDPPSSTQFTDYALRYTFECRRDLNCNPAMTFSMKAALEIAVQILGCTTVAFISFDSCATGDLRTVMKDGFVKSEHKAGAYNEQCEIVKDRIRELKIPVTWITPAEETKGPVRLNIGCGEVIEPGYVNIDLHHPATDEHMDAGNMEYIDGSVDEIYSSHLLEHFGKREVPAVLSEWFRILKVGGTLTMDLPNLEWCMKNWLGKNEKDRFGIALDMIYGLQTHEGEFHKTGFTRERLREFLTAAGFENIEIADRESHAQMCFFVTASKGKDQTETKNDRITVLTMTGDRPLAFALCKLWMERQIRKPDQWIVVDDGKSPLMPTGTMEYIRREPKPDDPKHTMLLNLKEALPRIAGDKVIIMEDDEYYAPGYIAEIAHRLERYEVVGLCRSKYYQLFSGGYNRFTNMDHASFAQTSFRASFIPDLLSVMEGDPFIDMRIWRKVGKVTTLRWGEPDCAAPDREVGDGRGFLFDDDGRNLYVTMKGMPGRPGSTFGHLPDAKHYISDTTGRDMLKKWIPEAFRYYQAVLEGRLTDENHDLSSVEAQT